jgi:hypothetical protein
MLRSAFAAALGLALLATPGLAQAQLELKPAVGLTYTSLSKNPVSGRYSAQVGYQLGATVLFGEALYVEGGLFYARKNLAFTETSTHNRFDTGVSGLRIPVMVGIHILGAPREFLALRVFGGGSAFIVTDVTADGYTKSDFTSPTYGLFAGAGVDVGFLFVDVKYEWSLTDYSSHSTVDVGQSRSLYANAGVKIAF